MIYPSHIVRGNSTQICMFLQKHSEVCKLLYESYSIIRQYFEKSPLSLELVNDEGYEHLVLGIVVLDGQNVDDSINTLFDFREDWWLDHVSEACWLLMIDLDFQSMTDQPIDHNDTNPSPTTYEQDRKSIDEDFRLKHDKVLKELNRIHAERSQRIMETMRKHSVVNSAVEMVKQGKEIYHVAYSDGSWWFETDESDYHDNDSFSYEIIEAIDLGLLIEEGLLPRRKLKLPT